MINGILSGLVGVTSLCAVITPAEAMFIGAVSPVVMVMAQEALYVMRIDDPVDAFAVHGAGKFCS